MANELAEAGLVRNARFFSLWLRYEGTDTQIGEGLYDLSPAMSAHEIALALEEGGRPEICERDHPRRLSQRGCGGAIS